MGDLERGAGALQKFQSSINGLLSDLETGPGSSSKVAQHTVERGAFSGGNLPFAEADGFYKQYARVHKELVSLSKLLADQMELLRLGVRATDVGLDNVDEDTRRRFHSIASRVDVAVDAQQERDKQHKPDEQSNTVAKDMG
ncbi:MULTISPECIES: hypothetical protein [Streptomyces]|uniref:Uncharacterized protein n=2 Tax=Streptomyces TaxID=1883 RepID=A0A124EC92_9ACTN|nr:MULTISPECIES: hypothetical protein [Streptomyces]KUH36922.1 hypothetical protein ATE80_20985 [Streptomyces kanasensis]UUS33244.1 hypothetical protein NRO40_22130 [Streptomyces changanensis]